jgi:hypothetical protein
MRKPSSSDDELALSGTVAQFSGADITHARNAPKTA